MNEPTPANVWMKGYLPDGRQVSITATPGSDVQALVNLALSLSAAMAAVNITVNLPGLEPGENKEQIVTVMRRAKPSDGTPIIDFYPAWGDGGDEPFGTYKYLHVYLNLDKPEMVTDFLAASGFKSLEDIPLYDAQSPLKRTKGRPHAKETAVPRPFFVVKKQGDEKIGSDGQPYRPWELVRYETVTPSNRESNGGSVTSGNGGTTTPTPRIAPMPATGVPMPSQPAPSTNGSHSSASLTTSDITPANGQLLPPESDLNVLRSNWVQPHETKDKTVYYEVEGGATTYSRELFRKVGYTEQDLATWPIEINRRITLLAPLDVYYKVVMSNGREFKQIVKIEKVDAGDF
jgi:hypothetical protein